MADDTLRIWPDLLFSDTYRWRGGPLHRRWHESGVYRDKWVLRIVGDDGGNYVHTRLHTKPTDAQAKDILDTLENLVMARGVKE